MKYYKNTEIAALFHVSEKAVRNWVESTQQGKLGLELYEQNGRSLIANTSKNMQIIKDLVAERKKFKNSRGYKVVTPKPEFYELYNEKQIIDIIVNLDTHREIPLQYSYFNGGALYWKNYIDKLLNEESPNVLTSMMKLLEINQGYIDSLVKGRKVNVIDLGVGEGTPARNLLKHLQKAESLNRYAGVDFSKDMLAIAEENIRNWFGESISFETYIRDLNYDRVEDILRKDMFADISPVNLVVLLGGTLTNFKDHNLALRILNASLDRDDYLVYGRKLDTESSRRHFDFANTGQPLAPRHAMILDLLSIDPTMYEVEQLYDEVQKARFIRVKMKLDIYVDFTIAGITKRLIIPKSQPILIWRSWHQDSLDLINQLDRNGFDLLHASLTEDKEYMLTISKIKR